MAAARPGARLGFPWTAFRRLVSAALSDRLVRNVLLALLAVDLAWILWFGFAKLLLELDVHDDFYALKHLRITTEGGWPEQYNHAKLFVLVLLLGWLAGSTRRFVYVALALLFAVALADDALAIHEEFGKYLRREHDIGPMLGLRAQDIGELITWGLLGVLVGPIVLVGLLLARGVHRANALAFLVAFAGLAFCAMFIDQLYHSWSDRGFGLGILLDMVEDGGEMIIISVTCAMAGVLVRHGADRLEHPPGLRTGSWAESRG